MPHPLDLRTRRIEIKGAVVTADAIMKALVPAVLPPERESQVKEETIAQHKADAGKSPLTRLDVPLSATVRVFVDLDPNEQCIFVRPAEPRWYNWLGPVRIILFGASFPRLSRAVDAIAHALKKGLNLSQPVQMLRPAGGRGPDIMNCECSACAGKTEK